MALLTEAQLIRGRTLLQQDREGFIQNAHEYWLTKQVARKAFGSPRPFEVCVRAYDAFARAALSKKPRALLAIVEEEQARFDAAGKARQ